MIRVRYTASLLIGVVGAVAATILLVFSGPLPEGVQDAVLSILPLSARVVQLLIAALLSALGLGFIVTASNAAGTRLVATEHPPEDARNPPQLVGEQFAADIDDAMDEIRLRDDAFSNTAPHQELRALTRQSIEAGWQYTPTEADEAIETGEWTDDPVARAFLSDQVTPPLLFRVLRWANPVQAYEMGLERTTSATVDFVNTHVAGSPDLESMSTEYEAETGETITSAIRRIQSRLPGISSEAESLSSDENGDSASHPDSQSEASESGDVAVGVDTEAGR